MSLSTAASSESDMYALVTQKVTPNRISTDAPNRPAQSKARRKLDVLRILGRPADTIPRPSDRMDQFRVEPFVDLAAQPAYVGFDDVRMGVEVNIPDVLQQHHARHYLPCMPH